MRRRGRHLGCVLALAALGATACGDDSGETVDGADAGSDGGSSGSTNDGGSDSGTNTSDGGNTGEGGSGGSTANTGGMDAGSTSMPDSSMGDLDSGEPSNADAGVIADAGASDNGACDFGQVQNLATSDSLDLFGQIVFYNQGMDLPEGRYRVTYVDGCMKYASTQDWTIHAYEDGSIAWFLGAESGDRLVMVPGTIGYAVANGAFADFEDCVQANSVLAPIEFDFDGGPLGVWLADTNYPDNVAGEDDRNPKWQLERLDGCE